MTQSSRIRVLAVDDHPVVRAGIAAMLASEGDIELVAQAANGAEAIALYKSERPDVVLMDLQMPKVDGVSAISALRGIDPTARIIALTTYDGDADIHRALAAGAVAYLLKDAMVDELIAAIHSAFAGRRVIPPDVAGRLAEFTPRADLTAREREVLQHVARGLGNKEIAEVIGRSPETVKAHLENIFQKLNAKDRAHAVTIALTRGFIHLGE
ncbi:MAG: response regulator transcription factor [Gemmatimonadaceae bacterium]|nr:response regulator transcription factor [Gemmatimonadaceae bacterium]